MNLKTAMDEVALFEKYCTLKKCLVNPYVREAFAASMSNGVLDLSGYSLSVKLCEVISNVLMKSCTISNIKLSDCMICPDGLKFLINSMIQNKTVEEVDLYGNNFSSEAAKFLGKLLRETTTIKKLILNWNNIGQSLEGFSVFCEGLARNQSLEYLDLRNNQLSFACGKHLSFALLNNKNLKKLDLRWNRLHNEGIHCIQEAVLKNKGLSELYLKGNFADFKAISYAEQQVKHNKEIVAMKLEYESNIALLMKELKKMEAIRIQDLNEMTELCNQKIMELENKIEEIIDKLINKEANLKQSACAQRNIAKEALEEKAKKLEVMEQLENVMKENIFLKEQLKIREITISSEIFKKVMEYEKELKGKDKILEDLKNEV